LSLVVLISTFQYLVAFIADANLWKIDYVVVEIENIFARCIKLTEPNKNNL